MKLIVSALVLFVYLTSVAQTHEELAHHYAPIHLQNVCVKGKNSLGGKSDYLTAANFDGDWDATNNWENLETYAIKPVVYYSIVENTTHYFIIYAYFHPRDWTRMPFTKIGQHENDLEGAVMFIEKDQSSYGKLTQVVTVFHHQLVTYAIAGNKSKIKLIPENEYRLVTAQQSKGHGCKIAADLKNKRNLVVYYPPNFEAIFNEINYQNAQNFSCYELVNIFAPSELWEQQTNELFFEKDQTIKGTNGKGANPPWLWQSNKWKNTLPKGAIATHPAAVLNYLTTKDIIIDSNYNYNPYLGIE